MQRSRTVATLILILAGAAAGAFAAKKLAIDTSYFAGKAPKEAGAALLSAATTLAGSDTFESIAVGRVLYLSGTQNEAKAIFDRVLAGKHAASDLIRIARIYQEAGDWKTAQPLFDQVLDLEPKDADWLAEIGAAYLKAGDRARAEALFGRSLAENSSSLRNSLRMASAYLGVAP